MTTYRTPQPPRTYGQGGMISRPSGTAAGPAPSPVMTFMTVAEVGARLRVSKMTVYRLIHGGELVALRVGRSFRIPVTALDEYLQDAS